MQASDLLSSCQNLCVLGLLFLFVVLSSPLSPHPHPVFACVCHNWCLIAGRTCQVYRQLISSTPLFVAGQGGGGSITTAGEWGWGGLALVCLWVGGVGDTCLIWQGPGGGGVLVTFDRYWCVCVVFPLNPLLLTWRGVKDGGGGIQREGHWQRDMAGPSSSRGWGVWKGVTPTCPN